jgi:hypothetical protein
MTTISLGIVDVLHEDEVGAWLRGQGHDLLRYEVTSNGTVIVEFSPR